MTSIKAACHGAGDNPSRSREYAGALPVMRGVKLNADDPIRRGVIKKLMCIFELDFEELSRRYGMLFADYFGQAVAFRAARRRVRPSSSDERRPRG